MKSDQQLFEDAAFAMYQQKRNAGTLPPDDGDGSRESLFWKQPDGTYGVLMFNAAWWGWQASIKDALPDLQHGGMHVRINRLAANGEVCGIRQLVPSHDYQAAPYIAAEMARRVLEFTPTATTGLLPASSRTAASFSGLTTP